MHFWYLVYIHVHFASCKKVSTNEWNVNELKQGVSGQIHIVVNVAYHQDVGLRYDPRV